MQQSGNASPGAASMHCDQMFSVLSATEVYPCVSTVWINEMERFGGGRLVFYRRCRFPPTRKTYSRMNAAL